MSIQKKKKKEEDPKPFDSYLGTHNCNTFRCLNKRFEFNLRRIISISPTNVYRRVFQASTSRSSFRRCRVAVTAVPGSLPIVGVLLAGPAGRNAQSRHPPSHEPSSGECMCTACRGTANAHRHGSGNLMNRCSRGSRLRGSCRQHGVRPRRETAPAHRPVTLTICRGAYPGVADDPTSDEKVTYYVTLHLVGT